MDKAAKPVEKTGALEDRKAYVPPYPERHDWYLPGMPLTWAKFPKFMKRYADNAIAIFSEEHFRADRWNIRFARRQYWAISDPVMIKELLVRKSDVFCFDPIRKRVLGKLSGQSLLVAEGEPWKRARRTVAPIFAPRVVGSLAETMRETCQRWVQEFANTQGEVSLADAMGGLAYEVLADALFSSDIQGDPVQLRHDLENVLHNLGSISALDALGIPNWVPRIRNWQVEGARRRFRRQIAQNITYRRSEKYIAAGKPDLLDLMLDARSDNGEVLSDIEIEDNLLAFVGAGYETTARALTWALYILSKDEHWRNRIEREIDAANLDKLPATKWAEHLPVTRAVFEETMRLYPPVPLIVRRSLEKSSIGDIPMEEKTGVIIWSFVLHRHKAIWEDPDAFRPERFLPGAREDIDRFAYLPFGAGARICVGMSFAMQEAVIALASLVRGMRVTYAGENDPIPTMRVTLRPDNGMPVRVEPR